MSDKKDSGEAPHPTLKTRFQAWWEGYDLSGRKRKTGEEGEEHAPPPGQKAGEPGLNRWGKPLWTATRIEVAEKLWGRGFNTPGGADHIPYLVKPMGLNPAMSVLDLSAGLGGTSRTMATKFGCWVTGLEASELLAKEGQQRSFAEGLEKKAAIELYDPDRFSWPKRVDAIVYKEGMFTLRDKDQMFDGIELALKPRGHILLTDYILAPGADPAPLKGWAAKEPQEPHLWTLEQMQNGFAQRNLDLRISEDITDTYRHLILMAIQSFLQYLEQHSMDHATKLAVMDEVELWVRRVGALEGALRCYRFYALKPAE